MLPTVEQGFTCIRVCQMLSNYYRNILLFRFDSKTGTIYILAQENMEIFISRDGNWRFLNEAGL
ncbi:DUF6888 family protein [Floridanema evergladense]|uniref:DUF6888 domain-containing protein n=1 Tax=Floridaenema evergladense BLCC-F167 TaxID=3153639 RepID=A0ABV4WF12_9CYAN